MPLEYHLTEIEDQDNSFSLGAAPAFPRQNVYTDDFHSIAVFKAVQTYRGLDEPEKAQVIADVAEVLSRCRPVIQKKMIRMFEAYDREYGQRLALALK